MIIHGNAPNPKKNYHIHVFYKRLLDDGQNLKKRSGDIYDVEWKLFSTKINPRTTFY